MKKLLFIFVLMVFSTVIYSQNPCVKIESILVDACVPGAGCNNVGSPSCGCEGKNEMLRFKIGDNSLNTSDLIFTWPNNPWRGICQNATSAQHVADMNATVQSCGLFLEPTGGILPAGATVLIVTSIDFCVQAHNWANLSDTIYVIFQCEGNFLGHFANWVAGCDVVSGDRTTTISFGTGCSDIATYNRCFLTNQAGGIGGTPAERDGARADFSNDGLVTYINDGCVAPFEQSIVDADVAISGNFFVCEGQSIDLAGSVSGPFQSLFWFGGNGVFSNPNSFNTSYLASELDNNVTFLYFGILTVCNDTLIDSVNIIVNKIPEVSIVPNGNVEICANENLVLQAVSNIASVIWNNGLTSDTIQVSQNGQYIVNSTNACGSDADTVNVVVNPLPQAEILSNSGFLICPGVNITLTGSGGDSYVWLTQPIPTLGNQLQVTQSGSYTLVAINDCGADSVSVSISSDVDANVQILGDSILCEGQTITLTAVGSGDFIWSNGNVGSELVVSQPGTYTVDAVNFCGSSSSSKEVFFLANPIAVITNPNPLVKCEGHFVELFSNNTEQYFWIDGSSNSSNLVVSPGIYQLVAVNFCGSDTTEIEVQDLPGVQISAVGLTQLSICADSQVTLQVNSNLPVFWSNGLSGNSITVNQPGVYAAISVNECDSAFIDFFVSELPNPIAIINESGPINLCAGDLTQLSTDSEGEILWSNGSTENSIIVSESGTYTLTVSNGCGSASSTIFVNNQSVIASFQADPVSGTAPLSVNFTNFTQGATQWNWNLGDGSFSTNENPSNIYNNAGQYEVVLAVNNGFCTDSTSITIIVFDDFELMIPNVFSPNNDGINDEFLISASGVKDFNVKIYNRWGNLVFTSQNSLDSWKGQNNAGGLSSDGVYFYILDVTKLNNEKVQLTGNVTLVR